MIDANVRATSYTLHFLIRCLAKGRCYNELTQLFYIWQNENFGLYERTRMEYWHLKSLINILIDNGNKEQIINYLTLTHELGLFDYGTFHSDAMRDKEYEIQSQIIRKLCFYGAENEQQINEWITFFTSHWNMDKITISNECISKILYWNEIHSLDGMKAICEDLGISMERIKIDAAIMGMLLSNMKRKSHQSFAALNAYHYSIIDGLELFEFGLNDFGDTFVPNTKCYNQLFAMIKSQNEIKIANDLLQRMHSAKIKPDKQTAINLIRLLYLNPSTLSVNINDDNEELERLQIQRSGHQILNDLVKMGLDCRPIEQDIYHELIALHAYYGDFTSFLLTLYKMKAEREESDDLIINYDDEINEDELMNTHKAPRKIVIDENAFEPIIEPILISKLAATGQVDNCCLILDEMIECGYRPAGPVYRDIIDNMGKYGYAQQALQMIDRAVLDGIVFSDRIWRYWLLSFAKHGQVQSCLMFIDKMDRSNNIRRINTRHFNGLLYAYAQNGDLDGIKKTYSYMIDISQTKKSKAEKEMYKMMKMRIKPDIKSYHIIARAYLENNQSEELNVLLESMQQNDISLDWKMYSIALQSMLNEVEDISWSKVQQFVSSVISSKKVFPRQPMVDDVLSASIQLDAMSQGLNFIHQSFDDPDMRHSTLPTEDKLGEFIAKMYIKTAVNDNNDYYYALYRGMMAYLTQKYEFIFNILGTKITKKELKQAQQNENKQLQTLHAQQQNLKLFRFRPRRLLQHALFALNEYFDPLTCTLSLPQRNELTDADMSQLNCRQLLVDILRHLFVPIDEMKIEKKSKNKKNSDDKNNERKLSAYSDEQLLSSYYPMIEDVLKESVKDNPNLVLLASSMLSIPIKPALFTKMIHSLVFNGRVETIEAIQSVIDEYYNSNAANPYIEYFQYEPDKIDVINGDEETQKEEVMNKQPEKPWLISSKREWTFLPYQMIDSAELDRIGMKISDLILFDALLYDERLDDALKHLAALHYEKKISYIVIKQIVQRTLNYMEQTEQLKINDKEYVSKITHTLSQVLNQIPTVNNEEIEMEKERKRKDVKETNELFECIWNDGGFTRGAIVLQGLLIKLDKDHCLRPHLQKFCVNEFSKLAKYGLLRDESDTDAKSTMLIDDSYTYPSAFLTK